MDKIGNMPQHSDDPVEEDNLSDTVSFTLTHWDMSPKKSTIHPTMPGLKLKLDNNWLDKMWVWIVLKAKYVYLDFKVFKYEHGEEHDHQPILFLDANSIQGILSSGIQTR